VVLPRSPGTDARVLISYDAWVLLGTQIVGRALVVTSKEQILAKAIEILRETPQGLRYSELLHRIHDALPKIPPNTIHGNIWNLEVQRPEAVYKPSRGHYIHIRFRDSAHPPGGKSKIPTSKVKEDAFYQPFADWLVNELEECTKAVPVGGNRFRDKWGTPDVIGIREARKSDIIQFPTEIVAAEVKVDSASLITAFGQACVYRLFSHKSYIVVPQDSIEDDVARLDALARIFGIGFILFNGKDPKTPDFQIRVRAAKHDPDMFYVNRCMKLIEDELFG